MLKLAKISAIILIFFNSFTLFAIGNESGQNLESPSDFSAQAKEIYGSQEIPEGIEDLQRQMEQAQKLLDLLKSERFLKLMAIVNNPEIIDPLLARVKTFNTKKFLILQGILFFLYLLIRSWYYDRTEGFFKKFFGGMAISTVFIATGTLGLPYLMLGKPYFILIKELSLLAIS